MDTRFKFKEVRKFFGNVRVDYKSGSGPSKRDKRKCYARMFKLLMMYVWCGISAPFVYPVWYIFRKHITNKVYKNTTWEIVNKMIQENKTEEVKKLLKSNAGPFYYWLWTYGDLRNPLGAGELTETSYRGNRSKNTFVNRFRENAVRNARFTINFMEFRTGSVVETHTVMDTRDYSKWHASEGIGSSPNGIWFMWFKDDRGKWGFIYEDNNAENIWYFGYVGLKKNEVIGSNGRFEVSYHASES